MFYDFKYALVENKIKRIKCKNLRCTYQLVQIIFCCIIIVVTIILSKILFCKRLRFI